MRFTAFVTLLGIAAVTSQPAEEGVPAPAFSPFGSAPFGDSPYGDGLPLGLSFPGVGSFAFNLNTPVILGLELAAGLQNRNVSSGEWANFTLPAPVRVAMKSSIEFNGPGEISEELRTQVEYVADNVAVALQLADNISDTLGQCLGVAQTVVQVGSVVRSASCNGTECVNSTGVTPEAVARAIERTLESSPEVRQIVNQAIDNRREKCNVTEFIDTVFPDVPPPEKNGFFGIAVTLVVLLAAGIVSAIVCCGCCMGCCCWHAAEETDQESEFLDQCHSLIKTPTLPIWAKVAFYAVILGTTGFFLSANLSVGATINLDYTVEGEFIKKPAIYDFSILASTIQMLKAGVYLLGFILLGFSVIWPYVKLIILSVVFALNTHQLRPRRRAGIMEWIDALGKWSMFDVFALCACMVIFFVEIKTPETPLYPLGWYGFTLSMTPIWGMYANLIAQIMSQCLSIFALWVHHRAYKTDWRDFHGSAPGEAEASVSDGHKKELQMSEVSSVPSNGIVRSSASEKREEAVEEGIDGQLVTKSSPPLMPPGAVMGQEFPGVEHLQRIPLWVQLVVCAMLISVIVLVICGFFITGFTVRVVGILGLLQEAAIPGSSIRFFTPLYVAQEMARVIPEDQIGIAIGTWCLIIMFVICVLVVPIAQAGVLLWTWALPVPLKRLKSLLKANELLASWQYIEVYLIAVIVGCMQIPVVCSLLVGDSCDSIQPLLDWLVQKGFMTHATCFQMQPVVEAGMWCLFSASIILYVSSVIVREAAFDVVNRHDPLRFAQSRPLAPGQASYYSRRTRILHTLGLVQFVSPLIGQPSTEQKTPVAPVAI